MTIIITMAGLGSRFREAGYQVPKYKIAARGRSLFEWSMESLMDYQAHGAAYIFVVLGEDGAEQFIREACGKCWIEKFRICQIDHVTEGQAQTAVYAASMCSPEDPILIYNIDTYVEAGQLEYSRLCGDGHIPCFRAGGSRWSFVRTDESGRVVEVREKKRISDYCSLGAYYFSSAGLYERLYREYYEEGGNLEAGEKYVAPLYNEMIRKGMDVTMSLVDSARVHVLGTPEELEAFVSEA